MDFNELYDATKGIFLYPGSVSDLNVRTQHPKDGNAYKEIELPGNEFYVTGIIVPSKKSLLDKMHMMQGALEAFGGVKFQGQTMKELMNEEVMLQMTPALEQMLESMYGNPAILGSDIRIKARDVGAEGLVHVQLFDKEGIYMGVPVKYGPVNARKSFLRHW